MKANTKIRQTQQQDQTLEALSSRKSRRKPSRSIEPTTEFGKTLRSLLGASGIRDNVNEEEFFAGAVYQLVRNRFGADVANDFKSTFRLGMTDKPPSEKVASAERAAKEALRFFVNSTILTREEAQEIRRVATATAQLDDNRRLWDSIGKTSAKTSFKKAQELGQQRLEASGDTPVSADNAIRAKQAAYEANSGRSGRRASSRLKRVG